MLNKRNKSIEDESPYDLTEKEDLKIGEKITGSYSVDLDIRSIHSIVRDVFSYNVKETESYIKRISLLNKYIESSKGSFLRLQELIKEKSKLENKLKIFTKEGWDDYIEKVRPILEKYSELTTYKKAKKIHIGGSASKEESDMLEDEKRKWARLEIIRKFIRISKNFIEMDIIFYPPFQVGCDECDLPLDQMSVDDEHGVYICECNAIFGRVYSTETPNIDPDKIDSGVNNSYDDKTNFIRRLKSYQSIQTRNISKDLLNLLDIHMQEKYLLPPASEIREMPLDTYGHRGSPKTSVKLLIETLKETNNSSHFQDINPICYELWGWSCPSIEHLVPTILKDYTKTQEVYKRNNPCFSSINVELRLYWHLRIAGHHCLLEDFKIPQSRDSRKRNSYIFKTMCEEVGLDFFPII